MIEVDGVITTQINTTVKDVDILDTKEIPSKDIIVEFLKSL